MINANVNDKVRNNLLSKHFLIVLKTQEINFLFLLTD